MPGEDGTPLTFVAVAASTPARRKRRPQRRDQILAAAVRLFHERGYHATGMDEIGAAAGITGPGIYRHFRNKEELLETIVKEQGATLLAEVQSIAAEAESPQAALEALADHYARHLVDKPSVSVVAIYERRTLSADTRAILERMERLNIEEWVHVLRQVRPELTDGEARVMVHGALGMGLAICNYKSGLNDDALVDLMRSMILTSLRPPAQAAKTRRRKAAVPSRETA